MVDDSNKIINIPVLDYLLSRQTWDGIPTAEALTGTLEVNIPGTTVDEFEIYNKYIASYPNLTIVFTGGGVTKANNIEFFAMSAEDVTDDNIGDFTPYYAIKTTTAQGKSLNDLIANNTFTIPHKASTNTQVFTFTGKWKDYNSGNIYYQDGYGLEDLDGAYSFSEIPTGDLKLFP